MIRDACLDDTPALIAMGRRFLHETGYHGRITENPAQMAALIAQLIASPTGALFVTERYGCVTGMIGLLLYTQPLSGELMASELFWWVEPEQRGHGIRLMTHAEQWARAQGATALQMIAPTAGVERLYERLGYARLEVAYQKALA